ncbi:MAG: preprotein translocase subunit SecA [Flavobacteriales bacterium]|jgi:preprotein translocase subunit SecA|nr:preprotein translocase subunit SecA [Flavobacteriales bacterium]MBK6883535.1 preprotein translocase subunit SecA [Flavobacteriales bacterium]MBK7113033.1 preprotein translocase subunit SecA [Flavobacteriales bacterium]MBK7482970.1 preprotein translocase subunit SecA [Flavobacteriales bacterium]MBK8533289.1 preprotein translocase subunit SecA [Flavobacteriales bacterium]
MIGSFSKAFKKVFGDKAQRDLKEVTPLVDKIKAEFAKLGDLSHDELRQRTTGLRARITEHTKENDGKVETLRAEIEEDAHMDIHAREERYQEIDKLNEASVKQIEEVLLEILPEAFAVVKETARRFKENSELRVRATELDRELATKRPDAIRIEGDHAIWKNTWMAAGNPITWDMVHYDVQLIGGVALHKGKIAEMMTGEGKTLVSTLPVFLNALVGRGVHLVTVNDYLAKRDAEWMGPLHEFHGLRVDCIDKHQPNSPERRNAYLADITYGTNNEFGFDYLRDNMAHAPSALVQRKHHYAIVDEVDSVLVDDARTPLIISGPTPKGEVHQFDEYKPRVERLYSAQKQLITKLLSEAKENLKGLGDGTASKEQLEKGGMALLRAYRGLPKNSALIKFLSENGVRAHLLKTENYYMQDQSKEMHKVDVDLYFTIDEKQHGIELTEKGVDLISGDVNDPEFFIMPDVGGNIAEIEKSDAAKEEKAKRKDELLRDFAIKSERIHTVNQLIRAYSLYEMDVEYVVMDGKVKIVDEQTGRILEGRRYSDGLHQAIESKEKVKVEASTQTYATVTLQNYFRMYHKLAGMTGTAETEAQELWDIYKLDVMVIPTNRPVVRNDSEDMVFKTKREKYTAVIDEIAALREAKRPVLVGTTSVEVSELMSKMLKMRSIPHNVLNAKQHQREAEIVQQAGLPGTVTIATNMAGRGTDIKLGPGVKEAGGLAIIGTEKHESRRVDRQLRGRAGRQGDPGSSQFYVSLEDDLMRLFNSERIAKLMDRMGLKEGEVIQHSMVTASIERAQKKVEENNFGIRKRLLEYDDVMNSQRTVIYKRRHHALFGERLKLDVLNMYYEVGAVIVNTYHDDEDFDGFQLELFRQLSTESPVDVEEFRTIKGEELTEKVYEAAMTSYDRHCKVTADQAMPVITDVFLNQGQQYENIVVPITDGMKTMQVVTNLQKTYKSQGKELISSVEKYITLAIIDNEWKEHLREMDELRRSVQNASIEQKDPLLIYKLESFNLFKAMIERINGEVVGFLAKAGLPSAQPQVQQAQEPRAPQQRMETSRTEVPQFAGAGGSQQAPRPTAGAAAPGRGAMPPPPPRPTAPVRVEKAPGRNDPCPCGSGKKYKQCHGKDA